MRYIIPDDIINVIISPKRAGTTWLQALLGSYLCAAYGLPDNDLMHLAKLTKNLKYTTAITHDPQRNDPGEITPDREYRNRRIAVLLRDPRDIIVSHYFLDRYRNHLTELSLAEFVHEMTGRLLEFYEAWLTCDRTAFQDYITLRYEDLSADTAVQLARLIEFLGYRLDFEVIQSAVDFASFSHMQQLEKTGRFHDYYRVNDMLPVADQKAMRTRNGKAGGYHVHLDDETVRWIEDRLQDYPAVRAIYG